MDTVRVGSRESQLAMIQTNLVIQQLKEVFPDKKFEIIGKKTIGDKILDKALSKIGQKSLFTKELETALLDKEVDFVVHSLKDLPTSLPENLVIGAITEREDPSDAVVFNEKYLGYSLLTLPHGSIIGTSSLRRSSQLKRNYPHLEFQSVRGNLNTRIAKLDEGHLYAAIILASAGLQRMGLENRISQVLSPNECMYAVGQGALAVECRKDDLDILNMLEKISHHCTVLACVAERMFLKTLEGGCSVPVAVHSLVKQQENKLHLELRGGVFSLDGKDEVSNLLSTQMHCQTEESILTKDSLEEYCGIVSATIEKQLLEKAENLGENLAHLLLQDGGRKILDTARKQNDSS